MILLHSATSIENGQLSYIAMLSIDGVLVSSKYTPDGNEIIVHNGSVHTESGSTGIPDVYDTSFYTVYKK